MIRDTQARTGTTGPASAAATAAAPDSRRISPREFVSLAARAFRVSYAARGTSAVVMAVAGFALALLPSLISTELRAFTDAVQGLYEGRASLTQALGLLGVLIALYLVQQGYNALRSYFAGADAERIMRYINERILRCTCAVKMRYIEGADDFAEKVAFTTTHAGLQVANSMQEVTTWLQNLVAFVALAAVLGGVNAWIVPVVLLTCLPGAAVAFRQEMERYDVNRRQSRTVAFAQMYFQDCTRFQCLQENKFQGIFPYIKEKKWRPAVDEVVAADDALTRRHTLASCVTDLVRGSVYLFILVVVARQIFADPSVGLGAFTLAVSATAQMQNLVTQLFFGAAQFAAHAHYMRDFFDLDELEREGAGEEGAPTPGANAARSPAVAAGDEDRLGMETAPEATRVSTRPDGAPSADICFSHVTFTYPSGTQPALRDVSVTIREGERVAIVGRNGSGKSTFVNLLCGLYEPQQGSVRVGGREVRDDVFGTRAKVSAIFQNFGRYEDTVRFNIAVSDLERLEREQRAGTADASLMELCEKVGAADFVRRKPAGLDEVVGCYSEGGANLSGGQWQRLAIARAAWCDRARIMLLDEPTSALDPVAEANVYRNFADLVGDRTALFVSHRLGVASIVDRVLVFDAGRIVEDGTPDELLAADGLFAELYRSQAQWYQ